MTASHENPYAVHTTNYSQPPITDPEATRKKYLNHEASVKSIGLLYWIGGVFGILAAIVYIVMGTVALTDVDARGAGVVLIILSFVMGGIAALQIAIAIGLRKLAPWSRIGASAISFIGLIGFPIGTIISAYFLFLLLSQKGVYVFSEEYKQVIAATPHIKYKTSIIVWILLGLLVALIGVGVLAAILSGVQR